MGIKGGRKGNNYGFGNLCNLKPVISSSTTDNKSTKKIPQTKTKTIRISEDLYQKFVDHSSRYYNVESYETILQELIRYYEENNQDTKKWYHNTNS